MRGRDGIPPPPLITMRRNGRRPVNRETIDHGLDGGEGGASLWRKPLMDLAHGTGAASPEHFHELKLRSRQFDVRRGQSHGQ
jgi:hypothetical protein